jgi:nucleotide-binding universal stress UspA family protein
MKDVLALVSSTIDDRISAGARYALALARGHGAYLSALMVEIEPHVSSLPPEPDNMHADEIASERPSQTERLTRTADLVLAAAKLANVPCDILEAESRSLSLVERVTSLAQVRDVVVIDVYGPLRERRKHLVDSVLFGSGRPLVLAPQNTRDFATDRIMIAWDATRSAVRAVHDALPLLTRASDVTIVSVIDDKTLSTPDSENGLLRYLARWNIDAKFKAINREKLNVGMSLLTYAVRTDANLLVMGGHAHGFERTLMFGSATRDIFGANLEIPVFLSH